MRIPVYNSHSTSLQSAQSPPSPAPDTPVRQLSRAPNPVRTAALYRTLNRLNVSNSAIRESKQRRLTRPLTFESDFAVLLDQIRDDSEEIISLTELNRYPKRDENLLDEAAGFSERLPRVDSDDSLLSIEIDHILERDTKGITHDINSRKEKRGYSRSSRFDQTRRRERHHSMGRMERNPLEDHERKVIIEFCHLLEKSKQLFNGLRYVLN